MIYKGESKVDGKTVTGTLMVEGIYTWIVGQYGRTAVWPDSIEVIREGEDQEWKLKI